MNAEAPAEPRPSLLTGALGAQVLNLVVPCVLLYWANAGKVARFEKWSVGGMLFLIVATVILNCPGTLILGIVLVAIERRHSKGKGEELMRWRIAQGAILGAVMAYLNLPAYVLYLALKGGPNLNPFFLPIMGLSGCLAGGWIGWRLYGKLEPPQPFLPRFSLGTLMLIVFAWAAILLLYAPKEG